MCTCVFCASVFNHKLVCHRVWSLWFVCVRVWVIVLWMWIGSNNWLIVSLSVNSSIHWCRYTLSCSMHENIIRVYHTIYSIHVRHSIIWFDSNEIRIQNGCNLHCQRSTTTHAQHVKVKQTLQKKKYKAPDKTEGVRAITYNSNISIRWHLRRRRCHESVFARCNTFHSFQFVSQTLTHTQRRN